jgi:hypothetical protein
MNFSGLKQKKDEVEESLHLKTLCAKELNIIFP